MSLIKCPDCSNEVSDIAETCPNCGRPVLNSTGTNVSTIEETSKKFKLGRLLSLTIMCLSAIILFAGAKGNVLLIAAIAFFLGFFWYLINKIKIWWHHK